MFESRTNKIQKIIIENDIKALLISSSKNIFYLTGVLLSEVEREGYLLITQKHLYLFTDKRYTGGIKAKFLNVIEISREKKFVECLKNILKSEKIKSLYFEMYNLKYLEFEVLNNSLKTTIKLTPLSDFIENLRIIKDKNEIKNLKKACLLTDESFSHILGLIKTGISEKELAEELEIFIIKNGGKISFPTIVAFGKNSAVPHHTTGNTKLKKNSIVLLDFGVDINGYKSDMTRTVFFGKANKKFKEAYKTVLLSQKKAIESLTKTKTANFPAEIVDKEFENSGFESLIHGLGHGIGLDIHEFPSISKLNKTKIEPGMTFTIEPGIYITNLGGVRIEDDILMKKTGLEILTKSKRELIEVRI